MSMSNIVECVEKQLKLLRRLATEHRQELFVGSEGRRLSQDVFRFHCTENVSGVQFTDKS